LIQPSLDAVFTLFCQPPGAGASGEALLAKAAKAGEAAKRPARYLGTTASHHLLGRPAQPVHLIF
jgi:hypothetical protein